MSTRVKIYGAGSIGNHLANASRHLGWAVTVCDVSQDALDRMRTSIYPSRYGKWDDEIELLNNEKAPKGGFDFIFIGTPPPAHLPLAFEALREEPRAILIEKPVCTPSLENAQEFWDAISTSNTLAFAGYDHVVGKASQMVSALIREKAVGEVQTFDVEFREHWAGIFAAHPWLSGPADTYLGFWRKGGGASGEHSHAMNLWQHFAHEVGAGRVIEVGAMLQYVRNGAADYDSLCMTHVRTETGMAGRVLQDVVTRPVSKRARIQGTEGAIEWIGGYSPEGDAAVIRRPGKDDDVHLIKKVRRDDFLEELCTIETFVRNSVKTESPISLRRGLDTMLVVAGVHHSARERRNVCIDYSRGYIPAAITPVTS